jgi:hypothetical protein
MREMKYLYSMEWRCEVIVDGAGTTKQLSTITINTSDATSLSGTGRAQLIRVTAYLVTEKLLNEDIDFRHPGEKGIILKCVSSSEWEKLVKTVPLTTAACV